MKQQTKRLTRAGIIAALYVVLIFPVVSFASGEIQIRPSEALCVLCVFFPEASVAMGVGCLVANIITGCTLIDIITGPIITFAAGVITYFMCHKIQKPWLKYLLAGIPTVLLNAFLLPVVWYFATGLSHLYIICVLFLIASETLSVYALGAAFFFFIDKARQKETSAELFK